MGTKNTEVASFKQVLEGKKIGVLHQNFPEVNLTTNQMKVLQEAILERIMEKEEGSMKRKFLGVMFKADWMVFIPIKPLRSG